MKLNLKQWAIAAAVMATSLGMCLPVYAADKKIENVRVEIKGDEPLAGEDIGSVSATVVGSPHYSVSDCFFRNRDDDIWERGTVPVVRVELTADNEFYFGSMSKKKIRVSGFHGEYKSSKVLDGGNVLQIDIKLRKVAGDLSDIEENYWDNKTAVWTEVDDADKYEVKLYRGTRTVTTVTTTGGRYNFHSHMTSPGAYSFKVRAVSNSDSEKSAWTDVSEDLYISANQVYTGGATNPGNNNGGPNSGNNGGQNISGKGWNLNQYGWCYLQNDGTFAKNKWVCVDNNWFYLDATGFMATGLQSIDGRVFYLNPVSDGTKGAMKTGFQNIGGGIYYFNSASDGTKGAMLTGYQNINGNWYFFDTANGMMWANRTAPNGKIIDGAGVVH
ncbi:MAG: hypothetical protein RR768_03460 [Clostridium sp.]